MHTSIYKKKINFGALLTSSEHTRKKDNYKGSHFDHVWHAFLLNKLSSYDSHLNSVSEIIVIGLEYNIHKINAAVLQGTCFT